MYFLSPVGTFSRAPEICPAMLSLSFRRRGGPAARVLMLCNVLPGSAVGSVTSAGQLSGGCSVCMLLRQAAGGMPNWAINQRVNELGRE